MRINSVWSGVGCIVFYFHSALLVKNKNITHIQNEIQEIILN